MAGVYANFANVSHSDYEFSITFVRLDHESEEGGELNGVVVSRVNLSTRFMKELVDAMIDNYSKWLQAENIKNLPEAPGHEQTGGARRLAGAGRGRPRRARPRRGATQAAGRERRFGRGVPCQNGQAGRGFRLRFALQSAVFPGVAVPPRVWLECRGLYSHVLLAHSGVGAPPRRGTVATPSHVFRRTQWTSTRARCSGST